MNRTKSIRVIVKIDVKENLNQLFALDSKVARASPALLPLETKERLLDFLIKDHNSETWVWKGPDGKFLGYVSLIDKPKEGAMEVLNICVDPDFQKRGYGKEMMKFAETFAASLGRSKMTLVTNKKNLQAIGFYKGLGYKIIKAMENYYHDGETRYLFEKTLE